MTLRSDIDKWINPFVGEWYDAGDLVAEHGDIEIVDVNVMLGPTRWGNRYMDVFRRDDEFVAVDYEVGSGDAVIDFYPEVYNVEPYETKIVRYRKV